MERNKRQWQYHQKCGSRLRRWGAHFQTAVDRIAGGNQHIAVQIEQWLVQIEPESVAEAVEYRRSDEVIHVADVEITLDHSRETRQGRRGVSRFKDVALE